VPSDTKKTSPQNGSKPEQGLTAAQIARELGVDRTQIGRWRALGCPTEGGIEAVREWRAKRPGPQQRFGNQNGKGKTLASKVEKWQKPRKLHARLTPELVEKIAECFVSGFSDQDTGSLCDVDPQTIAAWRRLPILRNAEVSRKLHYIRLLRDGKQRDWVRLAWWLERRYPTEFSRPEVAHAISVAHQTTTNVTQNVVISSDVAKQLAARSAATSKKIDEIFANRGRDANFDGDGRTAFVPGGIDKCPSQPAF
jgi:hypothetical protein